MWSTSGIQVRTVRKWRAKGVVKEAKARLRHRMLVGVITHGRTRLGSFPTPQANTSGRKEGRHLVQEQVRADVEESRACKVVGMKQLGALTRWENEVERKVALYNVFASQSKTCTQEAQQSHQHVDWFSSEVPYCPFSAAVQRHLERESTGGGLIRFWRPSAQELTGKTFPTLQETHRLCQRWRAAKASQDNICRYPDLGKRLAAVGWPWTAAKCPQPSHCDHPATRHCHYVWVLQASCAAEADSPMGRLLGRNFWKEALQVRETGFNCRQAGWREVSPRISWLHGIRSTLPVKSLQQFWHWWRKEEERHPQYAWSSREGLKMAVAIKRRAMESN